MQHLWLTLLSFVVVAAALGPHGARADDVGAKAVLELYTSQGCSSCPPADRLAARLAKRDGVLVLTLPVDYWDYLGWKDTLAEPAFSLRQRDYALARGDNGIYTPQIVVNGLSAVVGSNEAAIETAVATTAAKPDVLCTKVGLKDSGGEVTVSVAAAPGRSGEVLLAAITRQHTVTIPRGENAHERLTYTNVVRKLTRLGHWTGMASRFQISRAKAMTPDADGLVALVQDDQAGLPGAIVGVAAAR